MTEIDPGPKTLPELEARLKRDFELLVSRMRAMKSRREFFSLG